MSRAAALGPQEHWAQGLDLAAPFCSSRLGTQHQVWDTSGHDCRPRHRGRQGPWASWLSRQNKPPKPRGLYTRRRPLTELVMWARPLRRPAAEGSLSRKPSRHSLALHTCPVLRRPAWPVHAAVGGAGAAVASTGLLRPELGTRTPPHPLTNAGPVAQRRGRVALWEGLHHRAGEQGCRRDWDLFVSSRPQIPNTWRASRVCFLQSTYIRALTNRFRFHFAQKHD